MKAGRRSLPSEELRARLGINLRECRKRLGISQHELSFRSATHLTAISPLELGQKLPRIDTFIRLAGALEVAPNELTAGILWTPAEAIVLGGGFEVPGDPALAAEVAALREGSSRRRGQPG
jgi:transcriptional regulator with XRE-family HTH domain